MMRNCILKKIAAFLFLACAWELSFPVFSLATLPGTPKIQKNASSVKNPSKTKHQILIETAAYIFRYYNSRLSQEKAVEYARYVLEAAERFSLEPGLLTGLIIKESRGKADARSPYAVGLMQVYWRLHRKTITAQFPHIKTEANLMEPRNNIIVGSWLFSRYMLNCKGDTVKALQRYLGSNGSRYVSAVLKYRQHFYDRAKSSSKRSS